MCRWCSCCRSGGSGGCCLRPVLEQCDDQTTEQASALGTQHGTTTCNSLMVVPWSWEESAGQSTWQSNLQQVGGCVVNVKTETLGTQPGTTTCNRLMVVPWRWRGKHWVLSMAQPATSWWFCREGEEENNGNSAWHKNEQKIDGCTMNVKKKALGTQHGTTTCNRLMVVPWKLTDTHPSSHLSNYPTTKSINSHTRHSPLRNCRKTIMYIRILILPIYLDQTLQT
jgi:hypothetical protein